MAERGDSCKHEEVIGHGRRFDYTALILVLLLVFLAASRVSTFPREEGIFPLDDAYIHWVYARNIAGGESFSFNAEEPSMGSSSPVFVLIGALFIYLGLDYYTSIIIFSALLFIGSSVLVFLIIRHLLRAFRKGPSGPWRDIFAWLGAALFATNGNSIWYVLAGMETSLFVFLGLLGLYLYFRNGWDPYTGVVIGLLLWVRVTGISLALVLILADLLRRKFNWRGYLVTALVYAPCIALSLHVSGNVLPTSVAAKKMTYIDGEWSPERFFSFFRSIYDYLFHVPAFRIALLLIAFSSAVLLMVVILSKGRRSPIVPPPGETLILGGWALLHVVMYGLTFRTLLHHLRYLAVIYPLIAVLSTCAVFSLCFLGGRVLRYAGAAVMALLLLQSALNARDWSELYLNNVRHIREAYLPTANWIADRTPPEARVAAFDIGLIKHVSGRYVVDLGGLVDPRVHPYLQKHRASLYLRDHGADYIVYSREPDCDIFTGLYFGEYEGEWRLKQSPAASFSTGHYPTPTIIHSTRLDVYRIDGWLPETRQGMYQLFVSHDPDIQNPAGDLNWNNVSYLGSNLGPVTLSRCRQIAQCLDLTLFWEKAGPLGKPFWVKISIANAEGERIFEKSHIPTHNQYSPRRWRLGEIIRDHHIIWLDRKFEPGSYNIYLSLDWDAGSPEVDPSGLITIGSLTIDESPMKPVKMKWKRL